MATRVERAKQDFIEGRIDIVNVLHDAAQLLEIARLAVIRDNQRFERIPTGNFTAQIDRSAA